MTIEERPNKNNIESLDWTRKVNILGFDVKIIFRFGGTNNIFVDCTLAAAKLIQN